MNFFYGVMFRKCIALFFAIRAKYFAKFAIIVVLFCGTPLSAIAWDGKVIGIVDGDTIDVIDVDKVKVRLRLAQIDAPEKKQPFGQKSKENLSGLVYGKTCEVDVVDTDRYGRKVARVVCDGIDVNLAQVRAGMAWVYQKYARDRHYFEAEDDARVGRAGLWGDEEPVPPWEWRKSH